MQRNRILGLLVRLHRGQGNDAWIAITDVAQELSAPIEDVMQEAGALREEKRAERTRWQGEGPDPGGGGGAASRCGAASSLRPSELGRRPAGASHGPVG